MITLFNRRELTITDSMERQAEIRELLSKHHIDYKMTVSNRGGGQSRGSFRLNMDYIYEYRFYVHKDNLELAQAAIHGCIR